MSRITEVPVGPYEKWVRDFLDVSRTAHSLLKDYVPNGSSRSPLDDIVVAMSLQAEATSLAVRSAVTHGLGVPSFALTRVRLEQCIAFSFLAHVPKEEGWNRYLADSQASMFEVAAVAKHRGRLTTRLRPNLPDEITHLKASAYLDKNQRFKRTWTKYTH